MGEYATKIEDEEGKTRWAATDGKTYKTRSGAWKWSKRLESEQGAVTPEHTEEATEGGGFSNSSPRGDSPSQNTPNPPPEPTEGVEWASFDFSQEGDYPTETVPAVLKRIKPASGVGTKKTKKQVERKKILLTLFLQLQVIRRYR